MADTGLFRLSRLRQGMNFFPITRSDTLCRHTFASHLAMQGVPLAPVAALLQQSTTDLVRRYAHLSPAFLKDAIEQMSRFGKGKTPDKEGGSIKVELLLVSNGTVGKKEVGKGV